jgi:hypothetical protein
MRRITKSDIDAVRAPWAWDLGNSVLYDLCRSHPSHVDEPAIIAKVWLIGRSYSAAIERRRSKREIVGVHFYESIVAPQMKKANIDSWLDTLPKEPLPGCPESITIHWRLQNLFSQITKQNKRSLASKYLHFHFPGIFFIYDSRALKGIKKLVPRLSSISDIPSQERDREYKSFVRRCVWLRNRIHTEHAIWLTPRQLDKLLLRITDGRAISNQPRSGGV